VGSIGPNGAGKTTLVTGLRRRAGGDRHDEAGMAARSGRALTCWPCSPPASPGIGLVAGLTVLGGRAVRRTVTAGSGFWSALLALPRSERDERALPRRPGCLD